MSRSLLLEGSRSQLVTQLVYWDEEKSNFLMHYFPDYNQKRVVVERILSEYSAALEHLLSHFSIESLNSQVLIGSKLTLRYLDDHSSDSFTIVFPHLAEPEHNKVSFLSPLGFQLLMTRVNTTCQLVVPSGEITVRIEEVQYNNSGNI